MRIAGVLLLVLFTTGCGQVTESTTSTGKETDIASELAAIEELRDAFELAIREKRYDDIPHLFLQM